MSALLQLDSLSERRQIEDNKLFGRLSEKTQVLVPQNGRDEVTKNRTTHSYEVATSSLTIGASLAQSIGVDLYDIDYQACLFNVSILHDIGMSPFGHDGATFLDNLFKQKGLTEGFSDNNNNSVAIKKNQIKVRDYTLASIIKYPYAVYPSQRKEYLPMLAKAIEQDAAHYKSLGVNFNPLNRTVACEIMDEADANSYAFSDMADFLCIGNKISPNDAREVAEQFSSTKSRRILVEDFIEVSQSGNKSIIKSHLSSLKEALNRRYEFCDTGIRSADQDLVMLREFINLLTKIYYIKTIRKMPFHSENMAKFEAIMSLILSEKFLPSSYYAEIIRNASDEMIKLRAMRDMISETSDWYILTQYDSLVDKGLF